MSRKGIFLVSLDLELYWGMRDHVTPEAYGRNLDGVEAAVDAMLASFERYGIRATWATVGFLLFENVQTLRANLPALRPGYRKSEFDPYRYLETLETDRRHFIPGLVQRISEHESQEIATHSFSHFYCLEPGQSREEFRADLSTALRTARERLARRITSMVFPRNQWNREYLEVLRDEGIRCFRGTENHWIYRAGSQTDNTLLKRAFRLCDAYANLTGMHLYRLDEVERNVPYNLKASRFLRPVPSRLRWFEPWRLRRITRAMEEAAREGKVFHLWWHPHNFGADVEANVAFLNRILETYRRLNETYGFESLQMGEAAARVSAEGEA